MDLLEARKRLPDLLLEAEERGVNVNKFLEELSNALGTDNGVGGISADSNNTTDSSEDETEGSATTDVTCESGDGNKETEGSKGS